MDCIGVQINLAYPETARDSIIVCIYKVYKTNYEALD